MNAQNIMNTGVTTFFTIFDVIYADFVKNYGCGIITYKIEQSDSPLIKISFYGDGLLHAVFHSVNNPTLLATDFIPIYMKGFHLQEAEVFSLDEIKDILINDKKPAKYRRALANSSH